MHAEAQSRLETLMANAKPRTEKARIRALAPKIKAARAMGIPWAEICEALGVRRSTLLSALRGYETPSPQSARSAGRSAIETPALAPTPAPEQQDKKPPVVRKWGPKQE